MTPVDITSSTATAIARLRNSASASADVPLVVSRAKELTISSAGEYTAADFAVVQIVNARKQAMTRIDAIKKPINAAKDAVMALQHELCDPLDLAEKVIRDKQRLYKVEEQQRIAEAERAKTQEIQRLARIEEDKRRQEATERQREAEAATRAQQARTEEARRKATAEAEEACRRAAELNRQAEAAMHETMRAEEAVTEQAVAGVGSKIVRLKKWRVKDFQEVLEAVTRGDLPDEVLCVNEAYVYAQWRQDRGIVSGWPGFEVYEDTKVAGR